MSVGRTAHALGVLLPCRNEEAVLPRKLRNLAACEWPAAGRPHRVVVVDDGSEDATAQVARRLAAALFPEGGPVTVDVVTNGVRDGKPGAIAQGLRTLGADVDLLVLTDADVLLGSRALVALDAAFGRADVGMASGTQRFVEHLPEDGGEPATDRARPSPRATLYDRLTEWVRARESRAGLLFSVHGQLLAWRASLALVPTPGIAADDLDLVLQVRESESAARVVLVQDAVFYEHKTAREEDLDRQALRRARAFFQVVRARRPARHASLAAWLQWLAYRHVPTASPWLTLALVLGTCAAAWALAGPAVAVLCAAAWGALALTAPGRLWLRLMGWIRRAGRLERREPLAERWEMPRT